jgi:hypothetical protein
MPRSSTSNPSATHYIVDGSNIATEGRAMPSLQQLNDAVLAFIDEHPEALITVVVDATFGHRIDKKEVKAFDEAVANNELVTPPAGAVGRGDAFVLSIANKANAGILSNDSFQEFHGEYPWLFDDGRLIGGKPVPHVGWVFVERLPVRGPKSRKAVKATGERRSRTVSELASQPMPVPSKPPPGPPSGKSKRTSQEAASVVAATAASPAARTAVNELLPFLDFVERHPVGTGCTVVVESYASHGAYARAGDVLVYLPLRLMGDPMPRSARAAVTIGEAIAVVIVGYVPERRSIDAALVSAGELAAREVTPTPAVETVTEPAPKRRSRSTAKKLAEPAELAEMTPAELAPEPAAAAAKRTTKKSPAKSAAKPAAAKTPASKSPAKAAAVAAAKPAAKRTAKSAAKAPAKQPAKTSSTAAKRVAKRADAAPPPADVTPAEPKKRRAKAAPVAPATDAPAAGTPKKRGRS